MRCQIAAGRTLPSHGWVSDRLETDWRARTPLLASLAADEGLAVRVAAVKPGRLGWPCLSQCLAGYGPAVSSSRANASEMVGQPPSKVSGLLYGLGLGGFVDGIVLHQILQWHHMVSDISRYPVNTIAGLEVNTLADGFFHLATWGLVLAASIAAISAWRQGRLAPNWSFHFGLVLTGWGIFNVVEGLIDHQILGVHHVRDDLGGPLSWDIGFLSSAFGSSSAVGHCTRPDSTLWNVGPSPPGNHDSYG